MHVADHLATRGQMPANPTHRARMGILPALTLLLLAALILQPASAVELEPIQVRSRIGEPLLAEIRVRNVPPDAEPLSARLPDAVVFARVGQARPRGTISELQFDVGEATGHTRVIRVTTRQPVSEDFLTFLVQVDWAQGSLVREFSIALPAEAPPAVAAAPANAAPLRAEEITPDTQAGPEVDAESSGMASAIPLAGVASSPSAMEAAPIAVVSTAPPPQVNRPLLRDSPAISVVPDNATRVARPPPSPVVTRSTGNPQGTTSPASPASEPVAGRTITVRRGTHLTGIARSAMPAGAALEPTLVALLIANPDAFVDGNINRLKQGAVLRMPNPDMLAAIDTDRARALVSLHARQWHDASDPLQREAMAAALADIETKLKPSARRPMASQPASARMKILPPTEADTPAPDSASQVQPAIAQDVESLASRNAEIQHLQRKLAELERENTRQRSVIALQDDALAQAQQHLDKSGTWSSMWRVPWTWFLLTLVAGLIIWRSGISPPRTRPTSRDSTGRS